MKGVWIALGLTMIAGMANGRVLSITKMPTEPINGMVVVQSEPAEAPIFTFTLLCMARPDVSTSREQTAAAFARDRLCMYLSV